MTDTTATTVATVTAIWEATLGVDGIAPDENFLDLGGDSMTATKVIAALHREYALEAPMRLIFDHPTVAELAEAVDELRAGVSR
ncbi:phosphopantetheine-binding protein [Actinomadura atramentaria]|uniref:phosphopantetheine-binding protein n=1 Tax=Actinomadura atramentaria TaxID=1990 RepID=UPI00035C5A75|nr:phosphopantetheine-binding protein [Actinomadura atramentaria]